MQISNEVKVYGLIALGVVALSYFAVKKAAGSVSAILDGVDAVTDAVNPLNNNNIFYTGVNTVTGAVTGDKDFSLGVWAWEVLNPDAVRRENDLLSNPARDASR